VLCVTGFPLSIISSTDFAGRSTVAVVLPQCAVLRATFLRHLYRCGQLSACRTNPTGKTPLKKWQNVGVCPDSRENLSAKLDKSRLNFLKTEFDLCSTFLNLAATRLETGNAEAAGMAIANAEKAYQVLRRYLSDPKHISHLSADQLQDYRTELQRLRARLDAFSKDR
jgi:hypothetical protein